MQVSPIIGNKSIAERKIVTLLKKSFIVIPPSFV